MSDGMSEAYGQRPITKKINKNVSIDIDVQRNAIRIINNLDDSNEVEIKVKTLYKIVKKVEEVLNDNE